MTTRLQPLTIADWDAMPHGDGNRYEIIEGELFKSPWPDITHQIVLGNLIVSIRTFLDKNNPSGIVVSNPPLILSNYSAVIPDLVFFTNEQRDTIITDDRLTGPPALVIEIVSPGSANIRRDRVAKLQLYSKHRVPEYWIVDPKNLTVEKYVGLSLIQTLQHDEELSTAALPGSSYQLSEIFRHLKI